MVEQKYNWNFKLSYSAYSLYKESPLLFYFKYIKKLKPTNRTFECYGKFGNCIHNPVEDYIKKKRLDWKNNFEERWNKNNLDELKGLNYKPLDKFKGYTCTLEAIKYVKENFENAKAEFEINFVSSEHFGIQLKGFIDVIDYKDNGDIIFYDWKTNSTHSPKLHYTQRLFYSWLYHLHYGVIPKKCKWVYVKHKDKKGKIKTHSNSFTINEIKKFDVEIKNFLKEIISKGTNISNFEIGKTGSPFNGYKSLCLEEINKRNNKNVIEATLKNNQIKFNTLPIKLLNKLDLKYSYYKEGYRFSELYIKRIWDGKKHLLNKNKLTIPYAFINDFKRELFNFNKEYKTNFKFLLHDDRTEKIINKKFTTKFKKTDIVLRPYQEEAIKTMIDKKIGIMYSGTGCLGGDTYIELPRNLEKYPKGIKIKDLVGKKNFYVYTFNVNKKEIELKKCKDVWESGIKDVYKVTLGSGKEIISTLNHKFLLKKITYPKRGEKHIIKHEYQTLEQIKKRFDLYEKTKTKHYRKKVIIETFLRQSVKYNKKIRYKNNLKIKYNIPKREKTKFKEIEHRFIAKSIFKNYHKDYVVHHEDDNHLNNNIDNLKLMTNQEHSSYHSKGKNNPFYGKTWGENHPRGFYGKTHSLESIKNIVKNVKKSIKGIPFKSTIKRLNKEKIEFQNKDYVTDEWKKDCGIKSSKTIQNKLKLDEYKENWSKKSKLGAITNKNSIIDIEYIGKRKTYDMETEDNHNFIANKMIVHNSGKSLMAGDIIKKLNRRTLFLVNRIELVRQTKEVFENYLGVKIGEMSEGNLDINKQITVASIQTISAILRRDDKTTKQLKLYLHNITTVIYDEAQNLKSVGMYGDINLYLKNNDYFIGLSGTPFRNSNDTLEMNSLVGFVEYTKTTKELEDEGYLTPTKCFFINFKNKENEDIGDYNLEYDEFIVNNINRNKVIQSICNNYKNTKKILNTTKRIKHAEILNNMIKDSFVITGETNSKERKQMYNEFKNTKGKILIGSIQIFSAGINIPDLDIIINCSANKSIVDTIQLVGRVKRNSPGKKFGYYFDFNDESKYLKDGVKKRKKILREFGNEVIDLNF